MIIKKFNKILKLILFVLILVYSLNFVSSEETNVFRINLQYSNESVTLKDISLVKMYYFSETSSQGRYTIKILSYSDEISFSQKFDFSLKAFDVDELNPITYLTESTKELIVPYFSDVKELIVYDNDKIILEHDLSMYSTPKIKEGKRDIYFYIGIFLIILIIFIIRYLKKRK